METPRGYQAVDLCTECAEKLFRIQWCVTIVKYFWANVGKLGDV